MREELHGGLADPRDVLVSISTSTTSKLIRSEEKNGGMQFKAEIQVELLAK